MYVLIENGKIVGTTSLSSLKGFEVLPPPDGWDGNLERLEYANGTLRLIPLDEYIEKKRGELQKRFGATLKTLKRKGFCKF